uniref:Uncharacterized protein n=1 Tax=Panagrolaimus davidi TaxID=227884 RepID=A0A914QYZ5_9BILA
MCLMGLNCFACIVALFATACFLICYFLVPAALTLGYWFLLYKTTWAYEVAIISIIFFGTTLVFHLASVIIGAIALCITGTAAIIAMPAIGIAGSLIMLAVILLIVAVLTFFFGVGILGLLTSIHLLNTGAHQCPTDGADCQLLVILFAVCVFSNSLRLFRTSSKKDSIEDITVVEQITPENSSASPLDKSKILVTTFLFDPLAHVSRKSNRTRFPTVPVNEETHMIV